ncbi:alpha/beta fold hydrolase [Rudanella paleaurantiibacter]|uniref:Alpha/beta fold hydrolase n=1 Tax=Rudanella paleaurantiibacter TaxID=2614655 RepID=A0A7J5TYW0_9BACT|nr:alpha/beta fold hydrolase [Rudanella paleaurantiibacter]KAB7730304.1 alpha/beta fold hydrolase [Rudanella paleaurantiibacter]
MKLFFREVGDPAHPAIIILHGLFGSSDNWLTISKSIAAEGYHVYLIDQRNHGQSPRHEVFDYDSMAADLHEFIREHHIQQPVLVGHSMGGKTVMQYVMNYRNEGDAAVAPSYSKVVVVDIAPKFYPVHHGEILRGLGAINLATLNNRNIADETLKNYEPSATVRQFLLKNLYRTAEGRFDWRINLPVIEREIHSVGEELNNPRTVTEPTLFIRGSESGYIADNDLPGIQKLFPNSRVATISDAGHWVQAEKPAEFVQTLIEFIKGQ